MERNFPDRRQFLKVFAWTTAWSSLAGHVWRDLLAAEIQPLATGNAGILRLRLAEFPALLQASGSVRLGMNPLRGTPPNGPMPNGAFYPVIINRGADNAFLALSSRCPHQGCVVDTLDASTDRMTCPCHGSVFAIDGRRLSGQAPTSLTRYTATVEGDETLLIQIPNLGYSLTASMAEPGGATGSRLRLAFAALRNVEYEVRFRETWESPANPVEFATGPESPFDQTVFSAAANASVSLYVDRKSASGFYVVVARASEL